MESLDHDDDAQRLIRIDRRVAEIRRKLREDACQPGAREMALELFGSPARPDKRAGLPAEAAAIRERLVDEFARQRGWVVAREPFSLHKLRTGVRAPPGFEDHHINDPNGVLSHPQYFRRACPAPWRWGNRTVWHRPAAVLVHTLATRKQVEAFANEHGLPVELLPWSWHAPGERLAALLIGRFAHSEAGDSGEARVRSPNHSRARTRGNGNGHSTADREARASVSPGSSAGARRSPHHDNLL